jgi:hypothetical protein
MLTSSSSQGKRRGRWFTGVCLDVKPMESVKQKKDTFRRFENMFNVLKRRKDSVSLAFFHFFVPYTYFLLSIASDRFPFLYFLFISLIIFI